MLKTLRSQGKARKNQKPSLISKEKVNKVWGFRLSLFLGFSSETDRERVWIQIQDSCWDLQARLSSAVRQRGRERKGPPEIIQKFRLRKWPISSADFPMTPMGRTETVLALFGRRISGQYPAAPSSPGLFGLLLISVHLYGQPPTSLPRTFLKSTQALRSPLRCRGPLWLRVQSRSRMRLRIAASIALWFRACFYRGFRHYSATIARLSPLQGGMQKGVCKRG